jgi:hypothetical protein
MVCVKVWDKFGAMFRKVNIQEVLEGISKLWIRVQGKAG